MSINLITVASPWSLVQVKLSNTNINDCVGEKKKGPQKHHILPLVFVYCTLLLYLTTGTCILCFNIVFNTVL